MKNIKAYQTLIKLIAPLTIPVALFTLGMTALLYSPKAPDSPKPNTAENSSQNPDTAPLYLSDTQEISLEDLLINIDNPYADLQQEDLNAAKKLFQENLKNNPDDTISKTELKLIEDALAQLKKDASKSERNAKLNQTPSPKTPLKKDISLSRLSQEEIRAKQEEEKMKVLLKEAKKSIASAKQLITSGRDLEADRILAIVQRELHHTPFTQDAFAEVVSLRSNIFINRAQEALKEGEFNAVEFEIDNYLQNLGEDDIIKSFRKKYLAAVKDPSYYKIEKASPEYIQVKEIVDRLLAKARAQISYGDLEGARITLREIESRDPESPLAKSLIAKIEGDLTQSNSEINRIKTTSEMFRSVANAWQRPRVFVSKSTEEAVAETNAVRERLNKIIIPDFTVGDPRRDGEKVTLAEAIIHLQFLIKQHDPSLKLGIGRPINIIEPLQEEDGEKFAFRMEGASVDVILDRMLQRLRGYTWSVDEDGNVLIEEGEIDTLTRIEFFNVEGLIQRLGLLGTDKSTSSAADPFSQGGGGGGVSSSSSLDDITKTIKDFLASAGVSFAAKESTLAYDGSGRIIVKHRPKELLQIRNILRRYDETQQVEIETKFLEVRATNLLESGFAWDAQGSDFKFSSQNRILASPFSANQRSGNLTVDFQGSSLLSIPQLPPSGAFSADAGTGVGDLLTIGGIFSNLNLNLAIRALERTQEVDLLTAPRITVKSGSEASILVAQEFIYPDTYSPLEATVAEGSEAIAITGGEPSGFKTEELGIKLFVTPEVQDDRITLQLNPEVVQFEGFITYGSSSIALNSNTQVTIPPVFHQPIFARRKVSTKVTIFDGATVVIGGLAREEVKKIDDKVPVLGNLPLLGRFFTNEGEVSEKRNLLIFVTANLITPGGAPKKEELQSGRDSLFQNPIIITPGGPVIRKIKEKKE